LTADPDQGPSFDVGDGVARFTSASQFQYPRQFFSAGFRSLRASVPLARRLFVRDIRARYRLSVLGFAWIFLPAVAQTAVWLYLNEANILNSGKTSIPLPLYVLLGTLLWQGFTDAISAPGSQLSSAGQMLSRVSFPAEALLLAGFADALVNTLARLLIAVPVLWPAAPACSGLCHRTGACAVRHAVPGHRADPHHRHRLLVARHSRGLRGSGIGARSLPRVPQPSHSSVGRHTRMADRQPVGARPPLLRCRRRDHGAPLRRMGVVQTVHPASGGPGQQLMESGPEPVLEVRSLGKKLARDLVAARRHGARDILRDLRFGGAHSELRAEEFWALRDIEFDVAPGEALGVIGHNGAGKSTLLRVLHGLVRPDTGSVTIRGRHTALLDIGAPFNSILTGRENIETAAAVHGVPRRDTSDLVELVADFSELGDVLDTPIWTYSTGMQMRLGYAIAANLGARLLLVDEVIAVGDIAFQRKCINHIRGHLDQGGAVVLVSHDIWMIQTLCRRCVLLDGGTLVTDARTDEVVATYFSVQRERQTFIWPTSEPTDESVTPLHAEVLSASGTRGETLMSGDDLTVRARAWTTSSTDRARWSIDVLTPNRQDCVARLQPPPGTPPLDISRAGSPFACVVRQMPFFPGKVWLVVHLEDPETGTTLGVSEPFALKVESRHNRLDTLALFAGALSSVDTSYRYQAGTTSEDPGSA
jgi:ABC-type polysaccharide/polyol phosphate transport system ATPase subunit